MRRNWGINEGKSGGSSRGNIEVFFVLLTNGSFLFEILNHQIQSLKYLYCHNSTCTFVQLEDVAELGQDLVVHEESGGEYRDCTVRILGLLRISTLELNLERAELLKK